MSLTYNSEHLAWQQRVGQEKNRATSFFKTTGNFFPSFRPTSKSPFPNASQDSASQNYKTLTFNLAYTFGGKFPIKNATINSSKEKPQIIKTKLKNSKIAKSPKVLSKKPSKNSMKLYIKDLKQSIKSEKSKRILLENKLKLISY